MTCQHCIDAAGFFGVWRARWDAWKYRRLGPSRSTRLLVEQVMGRVARMRFDLLDVGGGVGAVQHELARSGANRIVSVDASDAYVERAKKEAERQGYVGRAAYHVGDIVELGEEIPVCDVVTLDRVVCCYPDVDALVSVAASHANQLVAMSFPRDVWWTRAGVAVVNRFQKLRGSTFRVYVHPESEIVSAAGAQNLTVTETATTSGWRVLLFERLRGTSEGPTPPAS